MNDAVIKLKNISTTCISDALDYFGVNGAIKGLYALEQNMRVTGRVFTVKYTLVDADIEASAGNYSDFVSENDVIVIDNDGRDFCTVWGDMYALAAANLKVSGVIINGCCRDVDEIAKLAIAIDENDKKILSAIKNGRNLTEAKKLFKCDTFANELMGVNQ